MAKAFVYALSDALSGCVRYVGVTSWPLGRFSDHWSSSDSTTRDWVRGLRAKGLPPAMRILAVVHPSRGLREESKWIARYARTGMLLNKSVGGRHDVRSESSVRFFDMLKSAGHSLRSLGASVGCSRTLLSAAAQGKMSISLGMARKVRDVTKSKRYPRGVPPTFGSWPLLRDC